MIEEGSGGAGGSTAPVEDAAPMTETAAEVAPPPPDAKRDVAVPDVVPATGVRPPEKWKPAIGATWDFQMTVPIVPTTEAAVYMIGLFETDAAVIADLHGRGRKVVCAVDMGTYDRRAPDAARFPVDALGGPYRNEPDRQWLDIRNLTQLLPIMRSRLDLAVRNGCDGVLPLNLDAWDVRSHGPTGLPIAGIDQLIYNRAIAKEARSRSLVVGLKDDAPQVEELVGEFDFYVSETCYARNDCYLLAGFTRAGKPVFDVEYTLALNAFCPKAKTDKISAIKKRPALDGYREPCPL